MQKYHLAFRCLDLNPRDLDAMDAFNEMRDKMKEIKFETFARNVDWRPIAAQMGYGPDTGLSLRNDYHVRFYKSKHKGVPVYIMVHSGIEYVFAKGPRSCFFRNAWD